MKKLFFIVILIICAVTMVSADEITILADEWMPYNGVPDSDNPGYMIEIAQVVFEKAGHTVKYSITPWSRAVKSVREDKASAVVGALKGDAPDFVFPDNALGQTSSTFFVLAQSTWRYTGILSLETQTVGIIADYSYGDDFDEYVQENQNNSKRIQAIFGDNPLERNTLKLLMSRITALVEDKAVMLNFLNKTNRKNIIKEAGTIGVDNLYIAFSPTNPKSEEYAKILSDGVAELRRNGELKKILAKYGLEDWK